MLEEVDSTNSPTDVVIDADVEHQPTPSNVGVGPSSPQAAIKVYATTAEAIANFKPTHREVISGIAPHVFDERRKRRSQRRASSPTRTYWCNEPGGEKRTSPLRGTIVYACEAEHSIYLADSQTANKVDSQHSPRSNEKKSIRAFAKSGASKVPLQKTTNGTTEKINSDNLKTEALWKYLRFDARIFKLRPKAS